MKVRINTKNVSDLALRGIGNGDRATHAEAKKALEDHVDEWLVGMEVRGRNLAREQLRKEREAAAARLRELDKILGESAS